MRFNWILLTALVSSFLAIGFATGQDYATTAPSYVDTADSSYSAMSPDSWSQPAQIAPRAISQFRPSNSGTVTFMQPNQPILQSATKRGVAFNATFRPKPQATVVYGTLQVPSSKLAKRSPANSSASSSALTQPMPFNTYAQARILRSGPAPMRPVARPK